MLLFVGTEQQLRGGNEALNNYIIAKKIEFVK